jgi:hypothetical protein
MSVFLFDHVCQVVVLSEFVKPAVSRTCDASGWEWGASSIWHDTYIYIYIYIINHISEIQAVRYVKDIGFEDVCVLQGCFSSYVSLDNVFSIIVVKTRWVSLAQVLSGP